ncbi:Cys-tRNA(Pro) deacylase [Rhizobium sp. KVB221]|uniref:Cys-tRNA(Pro)/Cys-tRNA(Cys) deacylase n=1 Tax=Rhizobium setariae TaxID=2801340 RepID=A0A937CK50_9HYPH|nr:Cys-tRNA(Pro) deacylase [Rhizobium setariae]MBL0371795.1 Cys-tRNA(Pro) deacylase [Rhizobium setariae]
MSKSTRATLALSAAKVDFEVLIYDYNPDADRIGIQAAEAIGVSPSIVLKTLMAEVDGKAVCVVVPSDREVSMKKLATAFKGKSANMMKPPAAEKVTGFVVGGISPFGQKKKVPTVFEIEAMAHDAVFMNGGQRGLQVRLSPEDARKAADAFAASVIA